MNGTANWTLQFTPLAGRYCFESIIEQASVLSSMSAKDSGGGAQLHRVIRARSHYAPNICVDLILSPGVRVGLNKTPRLSGVPGQLLVLGGARCTL